MGSSRTLRVNGRVITATNRNLEQAVREGRFRADLLYRLNVFPIEVPPLRERASDIPLLVSFFLTRISLNVGEAAPRGERHGAWRSCRSTPGRGNVRELQNILERAAILAEGPIVSLDLATFSTRRPARWWKLERRNQQKEPTSMRSNVTTF